MSQENVETVLRPGMPFSRGDLATVLRQLDPEVVSHTAAPLGSGRVPGTRGAPGAVRDWLSASDYFSNEVESHVEPAMPQSSRSARATGADQRAPVERTFLVVHTFNGEKIARIGIHVTEDQALEAAGLRSRRCRRRTWRITAGLLPPGPWGPRCRSGVCRRGRGDHLSRVRHGGQLSRSRGSPSLVAGPARLGPRLGRRGRRGPGAGRCDACRAACSRPRR